MIPFLSVAAATSALRADIDEAVARVISSGWYIGGPEVEAFENQWASFCGADYCVGVGNGLDALHLALRAMDVGPGDEVIVAANGFIATLLAVSMTGATPVLVEPDIVTHNIDPAKIEAAITSATRVILPTHLYGQPANLDPILSIARRYGLRVLEDGAQAHGARYKGDRIGAHGDAVTWSFYPSKNLGALGDAGAVTTNDPALAERIRMLSNYGSTRRYVNVELGVNSRLDPVQAAVLGVKLLHLDEWNARRTRIAQRYLEAFDNCSLVLPAVPEWAEPVWHLFVVRCANRDAFQDQLSGMGIQTNIHYPIPAHRQEAYAGLGHAAGTFPLSEQLADEVISLPMGPHLTDGEVEAVIDAVREIA